MVLQQPVQARQVLDDQVAQDPLVSLDTQKGGAEVGGRQQVLNNGTHHPEGIFLLQKQQEAGSHLAREGDMGFYPSVHASQNRYPTLGWVFRKGSGTPPEGTLLQAG